MTPPSPTSASLPGTSAVGEVCLRVGDLDPVSSFYESVVGLSVLERRGDGVTLGAGGSALLELEAAPDRPPRGSDETGLFHTAFLVPNRAALGGALERVESKWTLEGASDHRVSEALYLADPEGNGVEVYRDRATDTWPTNEEGDVEMDTRPLSLSSVRSASDGSDRAPEATTVGHVHLEVSSTTRAEEFYVDALGTNLRQRFGPRATFVAAGDYHHHVGLNTWNGRTDPATGLGLAWFEVVVPDEKSLAAARDRLAGGWRVEETADGFEVADPDGIVVRLRTPRGP